MSGTLNLQAQYIQTGDPTTVNTAAADVYALGSLGHVAAIQNSTLFSPGLSPRIYQFIQRSATDTTTKAVGQVAYWKDLDNYVVTSTAADAFSATLGICAGFFPSASLVAGNYGYIQVGGQGPVLVAGSPTAAPAIGSLLFVPATLVDSSVDSADNFADVAAVTNAGYPVAQALSVKNAGSIGTNVVEALLFPPRHSW
jgi:hypothetical protein